MPNDEVQQLVLEAAELTGAAPPAMLDPDAPVLSANDTETDLYLVGLIGGKDVGKSSLVNALVGEPITQTSSFGEGTDVAIVYAHESTREELLEMLPRQIAADRFEIKTHRIDSLRRQVLLDLPDIDSHWASHVQLTRKMLRRMLFPLWIQSIEKYADLQPRELLKQVAAGNDPANFLFCLNKVDQLVAREGQAAAVEIREDFARRIAGALSLGAPPRVYLISAANPDQFDLPELRQLLARQKSTGDVERGSKRAGAQRRRSLMHWLESQRVSTHAEQASRLLREAQELAAARLAVPLLEDTVPAIVSDPAHRLAMLDPVMNLRLSRWPVVNVIQASLSPLAALVRKNLASNPAAGSAAEDSIQLGGRSLSSRIQSTFAQLRHTNPIVASLYSTRRLWEELPANEAAGDLGARVRATIVHQREQAVQKIASRSIGEVIWLPLRWLLTIGALLWFPVVQPLLQQMLDHHFERSLYALAALLVPLLGASYLLHTAGFLIIYFVALWMILRWDTQRRVNRLIAGWTSGSVESDLSLHGQCLRWIDDLLEPMQAHERQATQLSDRINRAKQEQAAA